jgi:hypothetical protein
MARVSNSETGQGGLSVAFGIWRSACNNGVVLGKQLGQVHLGRQKGEEGLIYSNETNESESKTIWLKTRDAIKTAFNAERFQQYIQKLNGLAQIDLKDPIVAVDNVVKAFEIPEDRKAKILASLFGSRDLTQYGLVQAITAQAHELDASNPEEASHFEEVGGQLIESAFAGIAV